ncbi:MAG: hypothetical protein ACTSPA_01765 [Promethearchaeota archaeon]
MPLFKDNQTTWDRIHNGFRIFIPIHIVSLILFAYLNENFFDTDYRERFFKLLISGCFLIFAIIWIFIHFKKPTSSRGIIWAKIILNVIAILYVGINVFLNWIYIQGMAAGPEYLFIIPLSSHSLFNLWDINENTFGIKEWDSKRKKFVKKTGFVLTLLSVLFYVVPFFILFWAIYILKL